MTEKKHFVYKLIPPRPSFAVDQTPTETNIMVEHVGYWTQLFQQGKVVAFGPVSDPTGLWGLALVETDSLESVERMGDHDPAVVSGMATFEIHPMPRALVHP